MRFQETLAKVISRMKSKAIMAATARRGTPKGASASTAHPPNVPSLAAAGMGTVERARESEERRGTAGAQGGQCGQCAMWATHCRNPRAAAAQQQQRKTRNLHRSQRSISETTSVMGSGFPGSAPSWPPKPRCTMECTCHGWVTVTTATSRHCPSRRVLGREPARACY